MIWFWIWLLTAWFIGFMVTYLQWGEDGVMTGIYWLFLWPGMIWLTYKANKRSFHIWLEGQNWRRNFRKWWKDTFKFKIKGEDD